MRYQTAAAMHRDLNRFLNTQYPEFTPHDFSVFIKNTFASHYQEQKRKIVEFAKLKPEESTNVTETASAVGTHTAKGGASEEYQPPESFDPRASGTKVDLTDLRTSIDRKTMAVMRSGTGTNINVNQGTFGQYSQHSKAHSRRRVSPQVDWNRILPVAYKVGMVLLVLGGLLFAIKTIPDRYFTLNHWKEMVVRPMTASVAGQDDLRSLAPDADYFVSIHSNPVGADIRVNGVAQGFTPGQVRVKGNVPFHLTILKENYLPYERDLVADRDAITYNATLQPLPQAGYLSISLVAGGDAPVIEVNGQRLGEKPPIRNYPVPAGVPIVVRARNPFSNTYAEDTVIIGDNQKRSIELILHVDDRTVNNK
jgi:hypothetical protein